MSTPIGLFILFVLIFYVMTFTVYWFYSPGPEERRQAQISAQAAAAGQNATTVQSTAVPNTAGDQNTATASQ